LFGYVSQLVSVLFELLNPCKPYLPKVYLEADNEATKAYLFFQRLGAKADLINQIVAQIHNLPEALNGDVTDTMIGACEVLFQKEKPKAFSY